MADDQAKPTGPDLTKGIALTDLADGGMLVGHVGGDEVLLARMGAEVFAVAAHCSHYHGPLGEGLVVGDTVRCPWHHACFSLRTGEPLHPPALGAIDCWSVEQRDGKVLIKEKRSDAKPAPRGKPSGSAPGKIVIVGGGAAGFAAAEMLRRQEYKGSIVMLSNDDAAPVDRPNLSKDYLAGNAPEDWIPLRGEDFYSGNGIDLRLKAHVSGIDPRSRGDARRRRQGRL
jgi:nitrite reductase/ring-hydroxylating ferredoxin subunit